MCLEHTLERSMNLNSLLSALNNIKLKRGRRKLQRRKKLDAINYNYFANLFTFHWPCLLKPDLCKVLQQ